MLMPLLLSFQCQQGAYCGSYTLRNQLHELLIAPSVVSFAYCPHCPAHSQLSLSPRAISGATSSVKLAESSPLIAHPLPLPDSLPAPTHPSTHCMWQQDFGSGSTVTVSRPCWSGCRTLAHRTPVQIPSTEPSATLGSGILFKKSLNPRLLRISKVNNLIGNPSRHSQTNPRTCWGIKWAVQVPRTWDPLTSRSVFYRMRATVPCCEQSQYIYEYEPESKLGQRNLIPKGSRE